MMSLIYFNYWTDKIDFKERIEKELDPILGKYVGKELTNDTMEEIKTKISDWMTKVEEVVFDCEIKVEVEKSIIKCINVIPLDM